MRILRLALAGGVIFSVGLGLSPLLDFTANEGRYAAVAREIVASGGYILPPVAWVGGQ